MQELTFETILRLPQMELKKRLKAELKSRGYPVTDKPGYLYAEGTIPVLLVAHMDTVHRQPVEQVCYSADGAVAMYTSFVWKPHTFYSYENEKGYTHK